MKISKQEFEEFIASNYVSIKEIEKNGQVIYLNSFCKSNGENTSCKKSVSERLRLVHGDDIK